MSRGEDLTICPCRSCKNKLPHDDDVVKYHLIRNGFVENYTMWKFHGEADPSVTGASERNSSMPSSVNERGQEPSSSIATAGDNFAQRNYINIDDLLQDMRGSDGGGVGDDEQGDLLGPEDAEIFENLANRMDQDDVLFGNPRWLENFKEMKQAAIDPLIRIARSIGRRCVLTSSCCS